ncbi:MAG: class I SAM-dependent methyltransferase [Planctomycetes bacterium]|nr:class I SAM-dependent methyltransferase [Planctomycetota bacterium]
MLVIEKPAGVDVGGQEDQSTPGIVELLRSSGVIKGALFTTNRLSRYESGIIVLAKSEPTARRLRDGIKSGRWEFEYVAVVQGRPSPRMVIGGDRASSKEDGRNRKERTPRSRREKPRRGSNRQPIATGETVDVRMLREAGSRSLIRCTTRLATTHALRAKLRSARLRLLGDRLHDLSHRPKPHSDTCLHLSRITFENPADRQRLIVKNPAPKAFEKFLEGERDFERALQASLVRRLGLLNAPHTNAYRLLMGPHEDLPFLVADRFAEVVILQVLEQTERSEAMLMPIAKWYQRTLRVSSVYVKYFLRDRQQADPDLLDAMSSATPLVGEPASEMLEIQENGLRLAIKPYDGFAAGLFLDQRENRARVRQLASGKDVLNLFAYTCGFSVAAVAGGARSCVSVDISPNALEWGKENFKLNDLDAGAYEFQAWDTMEYLDRAHRRGQLFDLIILDPPSFAHGRKTRKTFAILEDLSGLVAATVQVLKPGGTLMVSTNHRKLPLRGLLDRIAKGSGSRAYRIADTPSLPPDFAMDRDFAKSVYVRFEPKEKAPVMSATGAGKNSGSRPRRTVIGS